MNRLNKLKWLMLTVLTVFNFAVYGYDDDKEKEKCRNPKIQEFTLPEFVAPENKEVPPETEFSFVVSGWTDPKHIKLKAKDKDIPFTVKSSDTFHKIFSKIPAEYTGKYIRLNARIPAVLGCYSTIGWLIKVADKPQQAAPAPDSPAPTAPEAKSPATAPEAPATQTAPAVPDTNVTPASPATETPVESPMPE